MIFQLYVVLITDSETRARHVNVKREQIDHKEYRLGRRILGNLPANTDLIAAAIDLCRQIDIEMATFTISGILSSVTYGVFDPKQQVYVTCCIERPYEIVSCQGNLSPKKDSRFVFAKAVLCDTQGHIICGRIFPGSPLLAAEIELQELLGSPLSRSYDIKTGLQRWCSDADD